uniref:Cyclotide n=3 Tax=Clitoria ternatea TaxID=43366 RepID=A0A7G5F3E1_CLITE|nr:cyclotide precursor [Clitoria ternatea]
MAYLRLFTLAAVIFFFAASVEKTKADLICSSTCLHTPCKASVCYCKNAVCYKNHVIAATSNSVNDYYLLCQSHEDCIIKESGNFCAPFLEHDVAYGWCFYAESEGYLLKDFLNIPEDIVKKPMQITS